jgi:hypothetical protein
MMSRSEARFDEACVGRQTRSAVVAAGLAHRQRRSQSGLHRWPDAFAATLASHAGGIAYQQAAVGDQWAARPAIGEIRVSAEAWPLL